MLVSLFWCLSFVVGCVLVVDVTCWLLPFVCLLDVGCCALVVFVGRCCSLFAVVVRCCCLFVYAAVRC